MSRHEMPRHKVFRSEPSSPRVPSAAVAPGLLLSLTLLLAACGQNPPPAAAQDQTTLSAQDEAEAQTYSRQNLN